MAKADKVIEFVNIVHEGTSAEHGNTQMSFYALAVGLGAGTWVMNGSGHRYGR